MTENEKKLLRDFKRGDKELTDLYHEAAAKMGISDSAFSIFYVISEQGEGCLQRDICYEAFINKQTVNSAIRKMVQEGYLYLKPGRGRDMHIYFTEKGEAFVKKHILPLMEKEFQAFLALKLKERAELIRLTNLYIMNLKKQFQPESQGR